MPENSQVRQLLLATVEHLSFLYARGRRPLHAAFVLEDGTVSVLPLLLPPPDALPDYPDAVIDELIGKLFAAKIGGTTAETIAGEQSLRPAVEAMTAYAPKDTACARDIVDMLHQVGERMTVGRILTWMNDNNKGHSESSIVKTLSFMSKKSHQLDNATNGHGRGYGVTDPPTEP